MFVEYNSTRRKKERCAGSAKSGRTGDGTDGKRRRTSNVRRNGKPDGQTRASGEKRATKRENSKGGAETSGGWRATKRKTARKGRKRRADGARRNGKTGTGGGGKVGRMARDETGKLARAGRKPQARRREDRC